MGRFCIIGVSSLLWYSPNVPASIDDCCHKRLRCNPVWWADMLNLIPGRNEIEKPDVVVDLIFSQTVRDLFCW